MIVFTGDWIKLGGSWKQVTDTDFGLDLFAVLDEDGMRQWFSTELPELFDRHISNTEMQIHLKESGL